MKLVWIAQDLHFGGGQRVIIELSARLARRGHEVTIIYPRGRGGFAIPAGVLGREVGFEIASPLVSLVTNLPALIAAVPPCDWILCSMPLSVIAGYVAGQLRSAKVLSYIMTDERILFDDRSNLKSNFLLEIYRLVTDLAQRLPVTIVVNSRWTGNRIRHGRGGEFPIIPHGVDLDIFNPVPAKIRLDDIFTIITIGRRQAWKGLADLIHALNLVKWNNPEADLFRLWILTQDALELNAAHFPIQIFQPGSDREIASLIRSADLLVHSSWFEGFGLPPLEAMACGIPTVITDSGGVREFAEDGKNCQLVPPQNAPALAKAIMVLMNDPAKRRSLSEAGIATALKFTWESATDRIEEVLKPIL